LARDRQRYLPAAWATDGARRAKAHSPTAVPFHTQPELARALVERARAWGVPFAWGVADAGSGDNPTVLQGLEARQLAYVVGVSSPFGGRLPIEQFYEDAQGACGLDDYQGRRWDGLHRHLALVLLAYSFLACQRWTPADPAGFSPSGVRPSFPAIHRQMLVWLFQDVVLWLMATNQITQFRPRRI
jgi:SRSO17 transposase